METRAEEFYRSFAGLCKDRFVAHMALLRERYEHHVANRHEIGRRYADFGVEDFEKSFFPRIDLNALEFFVLLSVCQAIADTMKDIHAMRKPYKDAVTVLTQEGSFFSPSGQEGLTAEWGEVQEPELFLFSSLQPSARDQFADWPRDWRPAAFTWNSQVWDLIREVVNGTLAKDWHKFNWWQGLEDTLRDRLLSRGLTVQEASHLIGLTWTHFFPKEMMAKHMPAAMRGRWRRERKK